MKNESRSNSAEAVSPVPAGYHTVTPYIVVPKAQGLIDFIEKGLGGKLEYAMKNDDGTISHSTVRIGDSVIMVGEQPKEMKASMPAMIYLYVEDVDALYDRACKVKGGKGTREPKDEFYGDRSGCVSDDWGNQWWIGTHIEDVSPEELEKRKANQATK